MIIDAENTVNTIEDWIRTQVWNAGASSAVVGLSGGADSALVALLCDRALPGSTYAVKMPCLSSPESNSRADELLRVAPRIKCITVDLYESYRNIKTQVVHCLPIAYDKTPPEKDGSLKSCLRTPVLDYVAKLVNGLIVGTGNKDEDEMTRYYNKRGDGAVDISPIAQLHKSEVYYLLEYLGCPQSIIDAVPTADLHPGQEDEKELGFTYDEIEWGVRAFEFARNAVEQLLDSKVNLTLNHGEAKLILSQIFTPRQVEILIKLDKMEQASRHKVDPIPVCQVRGADTVV